MIWFPVYYPTRDLRRRLGLLKPLEIHYLHYQLNNMNTKKSCPAVTCIPSNMQSRYMYHGSHTCTNQDEILKNWIQLNVVTRSNHCHPNYILLQERFFLLHFVGPQQELLSINLAIQAHACYMWDIIICYFSPACPHTQSWG